VTPVDNGKPVALVSVTEVGVPNIGVTKVGDVANTLAPVPVSSVNAAAKLADVGVAKNVATPVPKPLTPVDIGRPVAFVSVTETGVPKVGVTNVGDVAKTTDPEPVVARLPRVPALLYKIYPDVPLVTEVVPTVRFVPAVEASTFTVPDEFLKYNFSSIILIANSPLSKLPDVGAADAVVE